jgi:hypothetical protein
MPGVDHLFSSPDAAQLSQVISQVLRLQHVFGAAGLFFWQLPCWVRRY